MSFPQLSGYYLEKKGVSSPLLSNCPLSLQTQRDLLYKGTHLEYSAWGTESGLLSVLQLSR